MVSCLQRSPVHEFDHSHAARDVRNPERLADQWAANREAIAAIAADLATHPNAPWRVTGRGSSVHAGALFAAAAGLGAGRVIGEITPSLFTVYGRKPMLAGSLVMAISQSGAGSDIKPVLAAANATDALTLALTNDPGSRLAAAAARTLDLAMGPEKAVPATKTYLGMLLGTLVAPGTPVLIVCLDDATRPGLIDTAHRLAELEPQVTLMDPDLDGVEPADHPSVVSRPATGNVYTDAMATAFDCYGALEARAVALGYDPDQPPNVRKITSTY